MGDDAFAMSPNLLKPFGNKGLTPKNRIFNYRLSRSRMCVENTFGVLATKFRLFRREIEMHPEGAEKVVLAACVLHNMLRRECGTTYMPTRYVDHEDADHRRVPGCWRAENELDSVQRSTSKNPTQQARLLRDKLANHFVSSRGQLSGQYEAAFNVPNTTPN